MSIITDIANLTTTNLTTTNLTTSEILETYPFLKNHIGKTYYAYFKCIWLEDGDNPEYSCEIISDDITIVETKKSLDSTSHFSSCNKIVKFVVKFEKNTDPDSISWNDKYCSWTDDGCFKSIEVSEFENKLVMK